MTSLHSTERTDRQGLVDALMFAIILTALVLVLLSVGGAQ